MSHGIKKHICLLFVWETCGNISDARIEDFRVEDAHGVLRHGEREDGRDRRGGSRWKRWWLAGGGEDIVRRCVSVSRRLVTHRVNVGPGDEEKRANANAGG